MTLGGRDLREYRQEDVRRAIAVAGQDSHLFTTSIRENVRLARPEASDEDVEHALRRAGIWDWILTLPDGPDTTVGELGPSCPAASGSGSWSPARSSPTPTSSCSTSPRLTSIHRRRKS